MKAVLQRVSRAEVRVDGEAVGAIDSGLLILLCVIEGDDERVARRLAERIARFRCFSDDAGRMNLSLFDTGGGALVISQFTLAADGRKGRRPSFDTAAAPADAERLYVAFAHALEGLGVPVETGVFAAYMEVELVNDGPVTFHLEDPPPGSGGSTQVRG